MKYTYLVAVGIAAVMAASPASAAERDLGCTLKFESRDWSAIYQQGDGSGTVTCKDGSSMPVKITARGVGLSAGKWKIDKATGRFTRVRNIEDVVGRYATLSGNIGLVKSGNAGVASKGRVSLALAGHGEGVDLGVAISEFHIEKAGDIVTGKSKPQPPRTAPAESARGG